MKSTSRKHTLENIYFRSCTSSTNTIYSAKYVIHTSIEKEGVVRRKQYGGRSLKVLKRRGTRRNPD